MNIPLLAIAFLATALFAWVVAARGRTFRHWMSASQKIRDDIVDLVNQAAADHQLRPLAPQIIDRLTTEHEKIAQDLSRTGLLERLGLSIHETLGQQVDGRLVSTRAALGVASEGGGLAERSAGPRARHDLFFLLAMAVPLFVALGNMTSSTAGALGAASAFGVWGTLRLWNGKMEVRAYRLQAVLDEIAIYSLAPIQDRSQKAATLDLVDILGQAFNQTGKTIEQLHQAIRDTPDQVSRLLEARLTERTSIADALGRLGSHSASMQEAIGAHATVVKAIPERLSGTVAAEVSQGLEPTCGAIDRLRGELASSYGNMSEALEKTTIELLAVVRNFSDTRLFEQWLEQMGTSTQAVADLGQRLDAYFDDTTTAAGALHKVAAAVEQTQQGIAGELRELARLNQLRGVDEKLHAEKIFDLFRNNLEKIENEHRTFRAVVDEFIRKVEQDGVIREALRSELPAVMSGLAEVKDSLHTLVEQAQDMPRHYADILDKIQEKSAANEKQLYQILHNMSREFQKDHAAFQELVMARTEELVRSLSGTVDEANRISQERLAEQRKFLEELHRSSLEHSSQYQGGLAQMTAHLAKLSEQAALWDRIQTDVAKAQKALHPTLAKALSEAVGQGVRAIAEQMSSYVRSLGQKTASTQDQLAGLIAQVETQTQRTEELERTITATLAQARRATPAQMIQSALLGGILLALVLGLFGIG